MGVTKAWLPLLSLVFFLSLSYVNAKGNGNGNGVQKKQEVSYDSRSLIINGKRELLFSGSIHYTRSTPDQWPEIISKAKKGGLNVIQTYVFWNAHEPEQGKFNFEGQYDLVKYIKLIQEHGMYVTLRLGPFIQAEWNHGGLPYWLREVPDIIFRSDNEPFKHYMQKYVEMIMDMMKKEKLFAPQGGPIILAQIENEYNTVQLAYRELGNSYVQWAAKLAISQNAGVPWIMCKQRDAPDPIINSCNGRHCGDTFTGPNKPYKPAFWTENWTAQYRVFGDPPSQRAAEDLAFSVARFTSKNGSLSNYYMYHGGTNFGRTTSAFTTTRYYDEAPLDEYGLEREPKYGHLRDLHKALSLSKKALLWGAPGIQRINSDLEARFYEIQGTDVCAAFLVNNNTKVARTMNFKGKDYYLPARSISILPDCKTLVYNTQTIVSQHNSRNFVKSEKAHQKLNWKMHADVIPTPDQLQLKSKEPMELYGLTKDTTDYAWYTATIKLHRNDLPFRKDIHPVLRVQSLGHAMHAFVNGEYVGSAHGSHEEKSFVLQTAINLKAGVNQIALLGILVGLPDSGAYMEHRFTGPRAVHILGLNAGTLDLTNIGWSHQVGINGERAKIYTMEGTNNVQWAPTSKAPSPALSWFKASFPAPEGNDPVVVRMNGMKKGMVWINGQSIGRYWMSYLSPLGQPSQSEYHIPRSYIKPTKNLIVVFEEEPATSIENIEIMTVNRDTICSYITELYPPSVKSWARKDSKINTVVDLVKPAAHLKCPNNKVVAAVEFASFGDEPDGACGMFAPPKCTSLAAKEVVEKFCVGKSSCVVPLDRGLFNKKDKDNCPDIKKALAIQVRCQIKA